MVSGQWSVVIGITHGVPRSKRQPGKTSENAKPSKQSQLIARQLFSNCSLTTSYTIRGEKSPGVKPNPRAFFTHERHWQSRGSRVLGGGLPGSVLQEGTVVWDRSEKGACEDARWLPSTGVGRRTLCVGARLRLGACDLAWWSGIAFGRIIPWRPRNPVIGER